jgi:hypothetical protein
VSIPSFVAVVLGSVAAGLLRNWQLKRRARTLATARDGVWVVRRTRIPGWLTAPVALATIVLWAVLAGSGALETGSEFKVYTALAFAVAFPSGLFAVAWFLSLKLTEEGILAQWLWHKTFVPWRSVSQVKDLGTPGDFVLTDGKHKIALSLRWPGAGTLAGHILKYSPRSAFVGSEHLREQLERVQAPLS